MTGAVDLTNAGYNGGIATTKGEIYDLSVWARANTGAKVTINMYKLDGKPIAIPLTRAITSDKWTKYTGTRKATQTTNTETHRKRRSTWVGSRSRARPG